LFRQLLSATRQHSFVSQEPFRGARPYRISG
jgi:hypothetical protein